MSIRSKILDLLYKNNISDDLYIKVYKALDCMNQMNEIKKSLYSNLNNKKLKSFEKIYLSSSTNLNNRILFPCHIPNGVFQEKNVKFRDNKTIKVAVMKTDHGYYVQPREKYFKYEFENFFGLGCGNIGYDENITVFIPFNDKHYE
jgi:hypothetical protein